MAWPVFMVTGRGPDGPSRNDTRVFQQPANLTASVIGNSCRPPDRRIAARASRKGLGERDDEAPSDCCDRVGDVPFGSDRRRLWVGNPREWQIPRAARRNVVQRGDGASFGDQK